MNKQNNTQGNWIVGLLGGIWGILFVIVMSLDDVIRLLREIKESLP